MKKTNNNHYIWPKWRRPNYFAFVISMNLKKHNRRRRNHRAGSIPPPPIADEMVKKPRTGGGSKSPSFDQILSRDIDLLCSSKNKNYLTIEDLVQGLRDTYSHYSRHKIQPFTKRVARVTSKREENGVDRKRKRCRIDPAEDKLQDIEARHLKRRVSNSGSGSSSVSSGSESSDGVPDDDAVYEEKINPGCDLFNLMLRDSQSKKETKREALEMEVVENGNKDDKKVNLMSGGRRKGEDTVKGRKYDKNGESVSRNSSEPLFKDLGGMSGVIEELMMEVIVPFYHPHLPRKLGVKPTTGILLHGPPGCGKTRLAHAIANETKVPFYKISATELVSGVSGASEENIRELFAKAYRTTPSIVFIDEIDAIASKRENLQREMERRIVTQLMICMDDSHRPVKSVVNGEMECSDSKSGYVLVIGATNRPDAVDPALRRPGRFDREILLGVPDEKARVEILSVLTKKLSVEGSVDLAKLARATPGFVGADLEALANKAGNLAMKRIIDERKANFSREHLNQEINEDWWRHPWSSEEVENLSISMADFEEAAKLVQPSSRREGFSTIPDVNWDDVGGLHSLRKEFVSLIVGRIKNPEDYEALGIDSGTGFLLHGPPGCGKTLIAKAVANEAGANFIHIKGPELLSKYVGESESAVRTIFSRARTCSPCILFFDEVDALTTQRGREGGWVVERLLNQLLVELDGADKRQGVFIIGATNRIEIMDPALLRPGRFGTRIYVPLPGPDERGLILKTLGRKKPIDPDVDLMAIGKDEACTNFSGADMYALMEKACMLVLHEKQASSDICPGKVWTIKEEHFKLSLQEMSPSVSNQQNQSYERTAKRYKDA